jgi:hypothetical protein
VGRSSWDGVGGLFMGWRGPVRRGIRESVVQRGCVRGVGVGGVEDCLGCRPDFDASGHAYRSSWGGTAGWRDCGRISTWAGDIVRLEADMVRPGKGEGPVGSTGSASELSAV